LGGQKGAESSEYRLTDFSEANLGRVSWPNAEKMANLLSEREEPHGRRNEREGAVRNLSLECSLKAAHAGEDFSVFGRPLVDLVNDHHDRRASAAAQ